MKCGIEHHAAFYRGYLIDDRTLRRSRSRLATMVALWFLVYLIGCIAPAAQPNGWVRSTMVPSRRPALGALTLRRAQPNLRGVLISPCD